MDEIVSKTPRAGMALLVALLILVSGCGSGVRSPTARTVPHEGDWGIYELSMTTLNTRLVCSSQSEIQTSALRLNGAGDRLVFAQKVGGTADTDSEIFSIGTDGTQLTRLTENGLWDLYPAWSPDGRQIAFLSKREHDLDLYAMDAGGGNAHRLYDSGYHDADVDWGGDRIVFTSQFAIWCMNSDGTGPRKVSSPPGRGEWGNANLPKGDYDPRLSRDGGRIVFERLEDTSVPTGDITCS